MDYNTYANKIKKIDHDISALVNIKSKAEYKVIGNDIDSPMPTKWSYHTGYIYAGGWLTQINPNIKMGDIIYQNNLDENMPDPNSETYNDYLDNFILYAQTGNLVFIPFFDEVINTTVKMNYSATRRFFSTGYELNQSVLCKGMKSILYHCDFNIVNTNQDINIDFNYAPMLPVITEAVILEPDYFRFNDTFTISSTTTISTSNDQEFTIIINGNIYNFNQIYFDSTESAMYFRYHYVVQEIDPQTQQTHDVDYYSPNILIYLDTVWTSDIYKEITDPVFLGLVNNYSSLAEKGQLFTENYETLIIDNAFSFDKDNKPLLRLKTNSSCNYKWLWR